jgi:2-hydroxycyclohexanecarboxyl-CoA dehydrogenase
MAGQVVAQWGKIDVLVNNAGWDEFHFFLQSTPEFWEKVININYKGLLNTCYTVLPHMIAQKGGVIINMASDAGRVGSMGEAVYSGCKGAVIAFSKTLAREHARDNIRVNVVAPGITETALLQSLRENETGQKVVAAVAKSIPLGRRAGQAEEISPAVAFLASDAARYITGQVLSVNGGLTMVD